MHAEWIRDSRSSDPVSSGRTDPSLLLSEKATFLQLLALKKTKASLRASAAPTPTLHWLPSSTISACEEAFC